MIISPINILDGKDMRCFVPFSRPNKQTKKRIGSEYIRGGCAPSPQSDKLERTKIKTHTSQHDHRTSLDILWEENWGTNELWETFLNCLGVIEVR